MAHKENICNTFDEFSKEQKGNLGKINIQFKVVEKVINELDKINTIIHNSENLVKIKINEKTNNEIIDEYKEKIRTQKVIIKEEIDRFNVIMNGLIKSGVQVEGAYLLEEYKD